MLVTTNNVFSAPYNELFPAEQISADIVAIEHVSEVTVKAAAAIAVESDALSGLSVELKDEISRFTYSGQQDPVAIAPAIVNNTEELVRLTWLRPSVNCAT